MNERKLIESTLGLMMVLIVSLTIVSPILQVTMQNNDTAVVLSSEIPKNNDDLLPENDLKTKITSSEVIILYDATDNITTAAAELFEYFLKGIISYTKVEAVVGEDIPSVMNMVTPKQIVVTIVHGIPSYFRLGSVYISWDDLNTTIYSSQAKHHILASCFSSSLEVESDIKRVKGIEKFMDYQIAVPILTIALLESHYNIYNDERIVKDGAAKIEAFFNNNKDLVVSRIMNPKNFLAGENKTLHYTVLPMLENLYDILMSLAKKVGSFIGNITQPIIEKIYSIIPPQLLSLPVGDIVRYLYGLYDIPLNFTAISDNIMNKLQDLAVDKIKNIFIPIKTIQTGIGNFTFKIGLRTHKMIDGSTRFDFKASTVIFGFEYKNKITMSFPVAGIVSVILDLNIKGFFYNEILIDYYSYDRSWNSLTNEVINPETYVGDSPEEATSLVGYVSVPGPFEDLAIESWFGIPELGLSKSFRSYGGFILTLDASLGLDVETLLNKAGHVDSKVKNFIISKVKKLTNLDIKLKIVSRSVYVIFTTTNNGIQINVYGQMDIGLTLEVEFKVTKYFKFELSGGITFNTRIGAKILWTSEGLYLKSAEIYYPWITAEFTAKIQLKRRIKDHTQTFTLFNYKDDYTYYFPKGATKPTIWLQGDLEDVFPKIRVNVTYFFNFIKVLTIATSPGTTAGIYLLGQLLNGETEILDGTIKDTKPPSATFLTPAYALDPVMETYPDNSSGNINASVSARLLTESGDYIDVDITDSKVISGDMYVNGSVSLQVYQEKIVPLVGDNATIQIYAFDEHDGDNRDSTIQRVTVHAEFPKNSIETINLNIGTIISSGTFKYEPTNCKANIRVYYSGWLQDKIVYFKDDQDRIVGKIGGISYPGVTSLNQSGWTTFSYTQWITVEVVSLDDSFPYFTPDDNYVHNFNPDGFVEIKLAEIQFFADWDTLQTDSSNGKIILDHKVDDGPGIGKWSDKVGYSAWYNLEIPLHKFYTENLIPQSGWIEFTLTVEDSAGLLSTPVIKEYYYEIPTDFLEPEIYALTSNLVRTIDFTTPPVTISRTGYQTFDVSIDETIEHASYNFDYSPYTSSYDIHTGLDTQASDQASIWKYDSRVIKTSGSSTANGYWFDIYETITNINETYISVDLRSTDAYQIYIRVKSNVSVTYMTYKQFTGDSYYQNGYLYTPIDELNIGNWTRFFTDIQYDLRSVFPTGSITEVEAFLIRGSFEIDNIMLDGKLLEDAEDGTTTGWKVYDSDPTGAQILNIITEKPHQLSVPITWTQTETSSDSDGRVMNMKYRLGLDTSLLANGRYILTVNAYDKQGNGGQTDFWIYVDHTNPTNPSFMKFTPISYTPGYDSSNDPVQIDPGTGDPVEPIVIPPKWTFDLSWGASSDNLAIKNYKIYHDGNYVATTTSTVYSIIFNDQDEILGTWVIKAFDYAGNYGSRTLTISSLPDYDSDSVDDFYEMAVSMTDPKDSDSDNDGLSDGQEILTYHTDPKHINIYGYVKSTTGSTLSGVTIKLKTSSGTLVGTVTTNSNGWYITPAATNIQTESYTITCSLTDYVTKTVTIGANPSTGRKDVSLVHATTYFTGQTTTTSGAGLNSVKVEIININTGSVITTSYSGTNGLVEGWYITTEVSSNTNGYYQLRFSKSGYVTKTITVTANPGSHYYKVSLMRKVKYYGYVKNIAGIKLASTKVQIKTTAGTILNTVYTSSTGYYSTGYVNPIVNGLYKLYFYKSGYYSKTISVDADEGSHSYSVTLSASSTITVYGYVKSTSGAAIGNAKVVIKASNGYTLATVYTSSTGYYSATVSKGLTSTYTVTASKLNFDTKTYSIYSTSSVRKDFSLSPSSIIIVPF